MQNVTPSPQKRYTPHPFVMHLWHYRHSTLIAILICILSLSDVSSWSCFETLKDLVHTLLGWFGLYHPDQEEQPVGTDKWVHMMMYLILSATLWTEWHRKKRPQTPPMHQGLPLCMVLPLLLSGTLELLQEYLTTTRSGEWLDLLANGCGILLGTLLFRRTVALRRRLPSR